jgi:hypothetical protein
MMITTFSLMLKEYNKNYTYFYNIRDLFYVKVGTKE